MRCRDRNGRDDVTVVRGNQRIVTEEFTREEEQISKQFRLPYHKTHVHQPPYVTNKKMQKPPPWDADHRKIKFRFQENEQSRPNNHLPFGFPHDPHKRNMVQTGSERSRSEENWKEGRRKPIHSRQQSK